MNIESISQIESEEAPKILIRKSSEAPEKAKKNPFFDEEFWGRANSPDDIFLPDSDMAFSFALAAHEIGHLSSKGAKPESEITLDNFEETATEEQRAWTIGKRYLQGCIDEYFADDAEKKKSVETAIDKIEAGMMDVVEWTRPMYFEKGALDGLDNEAREQKLKGARERLASANLEEYKKLVDEKIKVHKLGEKVDWEKFTALVKKSVEKIIEDNEKA